MLLLSLWLLFALRLCDAAAIGKALRSKIVFHSKHFLANKTSAVNGAPQIICLPMRGAYTRFDERDVGLAVIDHIVRTKSHIYSLGTRT